MKIEHLIVQHLYSKKQVSLQGIGIIKLRPEVAFPAESDKDPSMPADAFSFEYNLKAIEDESLIDFIVQQTGKIKPLAFSDLESYAILAKQFLNLGKPFVLEGVGTIQKNQKGGYEFSPGHFINPKIDDIFKPITERKEDDVSFESQQKTSSNKVRNLIITLSVVGVFLVGACIYYFTVVRSVNNFEPKESLVIKDSIKKDTLKSTPVAVDSARNKVDSANKIAAIAAKENTKDSINFKIVLRDFTSKEAVEKSYNRLTKWGHQLVIIKVDSAKYKLVMPFTAPLSDTLRMRDSIGKFFGGKPYVQL